MTDMRGFQDQGEYIPRRRFDLADLWAPGQPLPGGAKLKAIARRVGRFWECPELATRARIIYSTRMRTTIGMARLDEDLVELNPVLLTEHPEEFIETLAHELAHLVVYWRYGSRAKPHGREFFTLMRAVNLSGKATHELNVEHLRRPRLSARRVRRDRRGRK
ncbi:MAG: SprT-like domain-containing protein [Phycisphaerae bacterium]